MNDRWGRDAEVSKAAIWFHNYMLDQGLDAKYKKMTTQTSQNSHMD